MQAEIITIGDEILIGQIVDTNSAWMGQQLNFAGIKVKQITSVSDDPAHIVSALDEARKRAGIILITGGLGPTKDDLTKKTLRDYFGMGWREDADVLADVTNIFARFGRTVTDTNRLQAQLPDRCTTLRNKNGTAPGMWFEDKGTVFVSMPGVPFEMKGLMEDEVLPRLRTKFSLPYIYHKTVLTQGIGESNLSDLIEAWEESLAPLGIKLAYLPAAGMVRLRLSVSGEEAVVKKHVTEKVNELLQLIPEFVYGYDDDTLQGIIGQLLTEHGQTLATAESCTGGYVSHLITSVAGSSVYFLGGAITYSNKEKMRQLGVNAATLEKHGAVSEETVLEMVAGARKNFGADYAIAVSGVAGPGGGSEEKPVGTVWVAVAGPGGAVAKRYQFGDHRGRNIERAAITALNMLRKLVVQ